MLSWQMAVRGCNDMFVMLTCRQVEEQQHNMLELENKSQGHSGSLEHLAMQVAKLQGTQANTGNDVAQVTSMLV